MQKTELIMTIARDLTVAAIQGSNKPFQSHANDEKRRQLKIEVVCDLFDGIVDKLKNTHSDLSSGKSN